LRPDVSLRRFNVLRFERKLVRAQLLPIVDRRSSDSTGQASGTHSLNRSNPDMPNTASAKKRMRQDAVRRSRNRATKSNIRTQLRKVREAITAKDLEKSQTEYKLLVKKLDKAAARKVIHRNTAARTKSRLASALKALKG
jgi:small subunit ribosomal protein S20